MAEGETHEAVLAARHLGPYTLTDRLIRGDPREVERVLRRGAVAIDGDDEGQADGVLAGIVEPGHARVGEELGDRERLRLEGQARQSHGMIHARSYGPPTW